MKWFNWVKGSKNTQQRQDVLADRFNHHLDECMNILARSDYSRTRENTYDLFAIAFVISDFAVMVAGKDRTKTANTIMRQITYKLSVFYPDDTAAYFHSRVDFYGNVVRGIPLHAHCLPGVDLSDSNPITNCAIAFCDCLMNPMYTIDYDDYCPPMFDAFDSFCVATDIMQPLNSELAALYNDVYTYAL